MGLITIDRASIAKQKVNLTSGEENIIIDIFENPSNVDMSESKDTDIYLMRFCNAFILRREVSLKMCHKWTLRFKEKEMVGQKLYSTQQLNKTTLILLIRLGRRKINMLK